MSIKIFLKIGGFGGKRAFWGGQSLIEILLAISLASVLLPALLTGLVASREGKAQEGQRLEATALLKGVEEAARSVYEGGWNTFAQNGDFHPVISGTQWTLVAGSDVVNGYTRQLTISDVYRDLGFNIVTSGGTLDPSTKKVDIDISWNTPRPSSVSSTAYFERHFNNASKAQSTQADFNGGSHNNTQTVATGGGAVELTQSAGGSEDYGNKFRVTVTSAIGNMTSSATKTSLRFTAQSTKTVNAISVYLNNETGTSPTYTYGIQDDSSGNPSGTYIGSGNLKATSAGWKTVTLSSPVDITAGTIYHIVVEHNSGAINTSRYIALRQSAPLNLLYPQTNVADSSANTLFNSGSSWTVVGGQPIYELDYSDGSFEGNPYEANTEIPVFGGNWYGERFSFSGADKTAQSVSFYVRRNGTPPANLTVQIRRESDNGIVYSGILATPALSTSYVLQTHTFSPSPITLSAGIAYRVIIQTSGGSSTNSYRFHRLDTTNAASFNSITYDGTNSAYTASTSSGSSWTDTNNWDIGGFYFATTGAPGYAASGDFTSSVLDLGSNAALNNITWTATVPGGTALQFQVAISGNPGGPFEYFGSDGSLGTFFTGPGPIPLTRINGRYVQYRALFTSGGLATPTFSDISFNYSP